MIRQATSGPVRVAIFGCCLADDAELSAAVKYVAAGQTPDHLGGLAESYVAVIEDRRTVSVVSDLAGLHTIFYTAHAGGTMFASSALQLADLHGCQVDVASLAAHLFCPDLTEANGDASVFSKVRRVPGGQGLILNEGEKRLSARPSIGPKGSIAEAVTRLREGLGLSVKGRLAHAEHPSVDLSGGLDSSSLAVLAARHVSGQVLAVTCRPVRRQ